ncbi:hypothetical protein [Vibrio phage P23]|nr:hypothetical protein [Vibrio phage P23]
MSLKVVDPIEVTDAVLTASDIPEPDTARGEVEYINGAFTGIVLSNGAINTIIDVSFDGNIYALDGFDFYSSGTSYVREYNDEGVSTGNSFLTSALAKCIEVYNNQIYAGTSGGFVFKYDKAGTQLDVYDLTATISSCVGICFAGSRFYILDQIKGKVFSFDLSFTDPKEVKDFGKTYPDNFGLSFINGSIHYVSQTSAKIKSFSTNGNDIGEFSITNERPDYSYFGGLYYDGVDILTVNNKLDKAYRYRNGVLTQPYNPGDKVVISSAHTKYQCLKATSQSPIDGTTDDATATWIEVGPTNKWAMFDNLQNTKTLSDSDFTVTLNPVAYVNTLAVFGFSGVTSIRIEVDDSGGSNIYDKTFTASDFSAIYDHYTYVFYQIVALEKLIAEDLPPLPNTTIRVTFTGSNMQIGEVVHGFAINAGTLVAEGTKSDRFRYREQQYNEFGYPVGAAPIVVELNTYDVLVPKLNNPAIQKLLDKVTDKNTLWVGDIGGGQRLITYGFFERSPIPFTMPNDINYQITVRASV